MAYKFKVGDKASFEGKEGIVVTVDKGAVLTYRVEWDSSKPHEYSWFRGRELDKVHISTTKLVVGQKYTPIDKTVDGYGTLAQSVSWKIAQEQKQNYLFYKGLIDGHHVFAESKKVGGDYFNPEDVIPYVEEGKVTPKFKLGDKVKIVTNTCYSSNEVGDVGEVFQVDLAHDRCKVKVPGGKDYALWSKFSDLELVTETKYVPKAGDTVKIIREGGGSRNKLGDIGTVTNIDMNGKTFKVEVKGGATYANWQAPEDVELVESDVIFTTKDGVDVRYGDKVYWVGKHGSKAFLNSDNWGKYHGVLEELTYFSSEKLAIEFKEKLENKTTTKIEKTMTIQEQIIKELGLQIGDTVKITHKVPDNNLGWKGGWVSDMDAAIGKEGTIRDISSNNVSVGVEGILTYAYPAQVLQFVRRGPNYKEMQLTTDYKARVFADRIEIRDQTITIEDFRKLEKLVKEIA